MTDSPIIFLPPTDCPHGAQCFDAGRCTDRACGWIPFAQPEGWPVPVFAAVRVIRSRRVPLLILSDLPT